MVLYAVLMTIAFLIAKTTIIVLVRKLKHARFDINSVDYLFRQAQLVEGWRRELRVLVTEKGITVNEKPLTEYRKLLLTKLKDKLDSVSVLSQSIKQLEEQLDKRYSSFPIYGDGPILDGGSVHKEVGIVRIAKSIRVNVKE